MGQQSRKHAQNRGGPDTPQGLRMSLLNMRQLYEAVIQEKMQLERGTQELKIIVAALLLTKSGGTGTTAISQLTFQKAGTMDGIDLENDPTNNDIILSLIEPEEVDEDGE